MTAFWTYDNLAHVTGGAWRTPPADGGATLPAALRDAGPILWHDTRELLPGQCYLAIRGESFDGHDFVEQAFEKGAALAFVNKGATQLAPQAVSAGQPVLEVEDTVKALQDLARAYRDALAEGTCNVIGVAGSNGKTTTRHLIHHVLTHAGKVGTQSPKSFNNHLGVPLTLLAARPGDDFVACEIGTNHPGEIDFLSAICRPDIAVITSIGEEHLEFFGDLEGVAQEEAALIRHVQRGGVLVTPGPLDSELQGELRMVFIGDVPVGVQHIRIGEMALEEDTADRAEEYYNYTLDSSSVSAPQPFHVWRSRQQDYESKICECHLSLAGEHNLLNATYAFVVASQFGLSRERICQGLKTVTAPAGRGEVRSIGSLTLVHDAYNANPTSMVHAIEMLTHMDKKATSRRVAVLGDMFELGTGASDLHDQVIDFLSHHNPTSDYGQGRTMNSAIDQVVLIGERMGRADKHLRNRWSFGGRDRVHCFPEWTDDLPDQVAALLQPGDTVLLKASRGMRLERLIPAIEKRFGKAESPLPVNET